MQTFNVLKYVIQVPAFYKILNLYKLKYTIINMFNIIL